jgi:hypothetical protein
MLLGPGAGSVYWACGRRAASYSCYWLVKPRGSHDSINKEGQQPLQQDMYSPKPTGAALAAAPCNYGCCSPEWAVYACVKAGIRAFRSDWP